MAQRRHQSLAISDVVTFHDTRQVPGRADDERGMHMIIAEELLYLPDGSRQRMPGRDREHRIADGAHDLIHRLRIIKTPPSTPGSARPRLPLCRTVCMRYGLAPDAKSGKWQANFADIRGQLSAPDTVAERLLNSG
jgi:hypothetical protein